MANTNTNLTVYKDASIILPSVNEIREICEDLADVPSRRFFGAISIAAAGAGTFKILEPGAEEPLKGVQEVECVIVTNHAANVRWGRPFSERDPHEQPVCCSMNGLEGVDSDGEIHDCAGCPYNQFDEDNERKECTNKRQLYALRKGDVLPMLFALPPSALRAFDNYRVLTRLSVRKPLHAIVTRVTLVNKKNPKGIEFSTPVFTPVGVLPEAEARVVKEYVEKIVAAAQRAGVLGDDVVSDAEASAMPTPEEDAIPVPDEDLPDGF